jgi:hypothetical protein
MRYVSLILAFAAASAGAQTVRLPQSFAPSAAIGYGAVDGLYTPVTAGSPLPVTTGGTALPVQIIPDATLGPSSGLSALNTDLLTGAVSGWYDAANFHSGSINIFTSAGISAGVISFEQTNDLTNASAGGPFFAYDATVVTANPISSLTLAASTVRTIDFPITARYIRFRISTAVAGGTVGATATFSQLPFAATRTDIVQASAANLNATVISGAAAEDGAATSSSSTPFMIGGFVRTTNGLTTLVANDMAKLTMTTGAALVQKPYSVPDADWQYSGTLTTTSAAAAKAAGAASIRNYVTAFQYQNISATATTVIILDGATAIHTLYAPANMTAPAVMDFPTPLRGTAATALNVNCGTTAANVLVNLQGYQAP